MAGGDALGASSLGAAKNDSLGAPSGNSADDRSHGALAAREGGSRRSKRGPRAVLIVVVVLALVGAIALARNQLTPAKAPAARCAPAATAPSETAPAGLPRGC